MIPGDLQSSEQKEGNIEMSGQPLVVLAGWLGCQHRYLKRYVNLYKGMGFDVLPVIASPVAIVESTLRLSGTQPPTNWPVSKGITPASPRSMQEFAWDILGEIAIKEPPIVLFHVFSNGGCFVWEQVRHLLDDSENTDAITHQVLSTIRASSIRGVVFDSCPAWFGQEVNGLDHVLGHCSAEDRTAVYEYFGHDVVKNESSLMYTTRKKRNEEYYLFLRDDPLNIPQLYLYSKDDPVADYKKIKEIVKVRKEGNFCHIAEQCWEQSEHCAHLLHHPEQYISAVRDHTMRSTKRSKH